MFKRLQRRSTEELHAMTDEELAALRQRHRAGNRRMLLVALLPVMVIALVLVTLTFFSTSRSSPQYDGNVLPLASLFGLLFLSAFFLWSLARHADFHLAQIRRLRPLAERDDDACIRALKWSQECAEARAWVESVQSNGRQLYNFDYTRISFLYEQHAEARTEDERRAACAALHGLPGASPLSPPIAST